MTSTNRRTFLAMGAAGTAGLAVAAAGCSADDPEPQPSPVPSDTATPTTGRGLAAEIMADKPLLYLDFQDDADATAPADRSGQDHRTVMHGEKWWPNDALSAPAPDAVGRAFYSGTTSDVAWIEVPDAKTWLADAPRSGVTVEMWLAQEDPNWNQTLLKIHSSADETGWSFGLKQSGDGLVAEGPTFASATFDTEPLGKAWHHIAFSLTADGAVTGYLDGKKVGQGNVGKFVGTVSDAQVGTKNRGKDGAALSGQWSHYSIFGSALSEARIVAHQAAGVAPAQPAQRGVSWDFGGPGYYKQWPEAEVLGDAKRFPVAEWWLIANNAEEATAEKKYVHGGVVLDPKTKGEYMRQSGLWAIRSMTMDKLNQGGAETIGWLPEDEADMDAEKMKILARNAPKVPDGHLSYSNYGTGVTISTIDRYRVRPLIDRDDIHQVSADLYSYQTTPKMVEDMVRSWGITPEIARRARAHGYVVERCRSFLTRPRPVWGVVATGHANVVQKGDAGWGSIPSADEVEGAIMSCLIAGATGILLFPQNFADGKPAPVWKASASYKAGDTVRDPKEQYRFWYARTDPKKGVDPNTVTDDSWLSWRPNPQGLRDTGHYARGVSDRIASVVARLQELAPLLHSTSQPHRFNAKLFTRYWPTSPDGQAYALAMQEMEHEKGEYEFTMPEGVDVSEVEVVDEDRTLKVSDGRFTDSFAHEWEHHLYRWKV